MASITRSSNEVLYVCYDFIKNISYPEETRRWGLSEREIINAKKHKVENIIKICLHPLCQGIVTLSLDELELIGGFLGDKGKNE